MIDTHQDTRIDASRGDAGRDDVAPASATPAVKRVPRSPYVIPSSVADAGRVRVGGV